LFLPLLMSTALYAYPQQLYGRLLFIE
jgi:hypothetical protein